MRLSVGLNEPELICEIVILERFPVAELLFRQVVVLEPFDAEVDPFEHSKFLLMLVDFQLPFTADLVHILEGFVLLLVLLLDIKHRKERLFLDLLLLLGLVRLRVRLSLRLHILVLLLYVSEEVGLRLVLVDQL